MTPEQEQKDANNNIDKEKKDNSGAIFKNDRKQREDQPDLNGHAIIHGQEFWVSAWKKNGRNGPFYSLSFTPKDAPADGDDDLI